MAASANTALLPPSQSLYGQQPMVSVKKKPLEEDGNSNRGLVIDLMPRNHPPSSYTKLVEDLSDNNTGGYPTDLSSQGKYLEQTSPRYHPYQRAPREDRDSDRGRDSHCQNNGNIPTHFRAATDASSGFSDEEADDLNRSGSLEQNGNIMTGTLHCAISKDRLNDLGASQNGAKREFVPEFKKNMQYWSKRHKNTIYVKRYRVKQKTIEKLLEHRMLELQSENMELRRELWKLQTIFGLPVTKTQAPSSSPAGSPGSSSSSSGIGNSSSGAPSLHSNSSSPAQCVEEEKGKKAGYQLKVKLANAGQNGNVMNKSCEREGGPGYRAGNAHSQSASSLSPPAAHFSSASQPKPSSLSDSGAYPLLRTSITCTERFLCHPPIATPTGTTPHPPRIAALLREAVITVSRQRLPRATPSTLLLCTPAATPHSLSIPVRTDAGRGIIIPGSSPREVAPPFPPPVPPPLPQPTAGVLTMRTSVQPLPPPPRGTPLSLGPPLRITPLRTTWRRRATVPPTPAPHQAPAPTFQTTTTSSLAPNAALQLVTAPRRAAGRPRSARTFSATTETAPPRSAAAPVCLTAAQDRASGGSPVLVSEDDASSGSGESRRSSSNSFDEDIFRKIPLKFRMKRGLYSP